jgi:hypothetical protein
MTVTNAIHMDAQAAAYVERISRSFCPDEEGQRNLIELTRKEWINWLSQGGDEVRLRRHLFAFMHSHFKEAVLAAAGARATALGEAGTSLKKSPA